MEKKVALKGRILNIEEGKYHEGNARAITLRGFDGETYCVVTVNAPTVVLAPDEILVKDWGENKGIEELLESPFFEDTGMRIRLSPWVVAQVWKYKEQNQEK